MNFEEKVNKAQEKNNSLLCVGLDVVLEKLPEKVQKEKNPLFTFNKAIIDATYDLVCCYKPNSAFYEAFGEQGIGELKKTCNYIKTNYPDIPIILDAKRGDIESTNKGYVTLAFDYLGVDGITVNPYLGKDALQPFLDLKEKGIFILCKTSNKGSDEFQKDLYLKVADHVVNIWNTNNNCFLVVGATYPEELENIRKSVGEMTLLVPGLGKQGGNLKSIMQAGLNGIKKGMIINSSRDILYTANTDDFAQSAREKAIELRDSINSYRV